MAVLNCPLWNGWRCFYILTVHYFIIACLATARPLDAFCTLKILCSNFLLCFFCWREMGSLWNGICHGICTYLCKHRLLHHQRFRDVPLVIFYCLMFVFIWLPHEWCERVFIWITLEIRCCLFYSSFQTWMSAKSTCVHMVFPSKFEKYIVTPERMELDCFYGILIEFSIEFTLISVQE